MSASLNRNLHESPRFNGTSLPESEENFQPDLVGDVLRVIYPGMSKETEAQVARVCGFTDRQARAVIKGDAPIPGPLLVAIMAKLTRRPQKPRR